MSRRASLVWANATLLVLLIAHTADHELNQPSRELPGVLALIGLIGFFAAAGSLALAVSGDSRAPLASLAVGALTVASFIVIHLVPNWGAVSDPYADFAADALSWVLVLAPVAAAGWLAVTAARDLRPA